MSIVSGLGRVKDTKGARSVLSSTDTSEVTREPPMLVVSIVPGGSESVKTPIKILCRLRVMSL